MVDVWTQRKMFFFQANWGKWRETQAGIVSPFSELASMIQTHLRAWAGPNVLPGSGDILWAPELTGWWKWKQSCSGWLPRALDLDSLSLPQKIQVTHPLHLAPATQLSFYFWCPLYPSEAKASLSYWGSWHTPRIWEGGFRLRWWVLKDRHICQHQAWFHSSHTCHPVKLLQVREQLNCPKFKQCMGI